MFLLTKSERAVPEDIHIQQPFMVSFKNSKVSGAGSSKEKNQVCGMNFFLD